MTSCPGLPSSFFEQIPPYVKISSAAAVLDVPFVSAFDEVRHLIQEGPLLPLMMRLQTLSSPRRYSFPVSETGWPEEPCRIR